MAATFALATGAELLLGATTSAWIVEGLFITAVMAVIFARFCLGSYLYEQH
jgi:hypothetical protein